MSNLSSIMHKIKLGSVGAAEKQIKKVLPLKSKLELDQFQDYICSSEMTLRNRI